MSTAITSPLKASITNAAISYAIGLILVLWFALVCLGSLSGFLASLHLPWIAAMVTVSIVLPTALYFLSPRLQAYADWIGHRKLALMHIWRIPAALVFFWYGAQGQLPPLFWILAGLGDFVAGCKAVQLINQPESHARYLRFHRFGFADFVIAVGTGLAFTLQLDPRMQTLATLPMALIPLFGVGLSGFVHLVAFDMLRRGTGLQRKLEPSL
jgi:hypothetical protein